MLKLLGIIFIILIMFIIFSGGETTHTGSSGTSIGTKKTNEIKMTEEMKIAVTDAIQGAGFNCPEAKIAWAKGEDAYGTATKVYCGPKGKSGVYEHAVFRLTFTPNNRIIVKPWK